MSKDRCWTFYSSPNRSTSSHWSRRLSCTRKKKDALQEIDRCDEAWVYIILWHLPPTCYFLLSFLPSSLFLGSWGKGKEKKTFNGRHRRVGWWKPVTGVRNAFVTVARLSATSIQKEWWYFSDISRGRKAFETSRKRRRRHKNRLPFLSHYNPPIL